VPFDHGGCRFYVNAFWAVFPKSGLVFLTFASCRLTSLRCLVVVQLGNPDTWVEIRVTDRGMGTAWRRECGSAARQYS
jgi:hypothetical protein